MTLDSSRKEFALIDQIARRGATNKQVLLGIGDDCASLGLTPGAQVLVTTDMLMDGRHFRVDSQPIKEIGHKCLAVNLSDIAAMAGRPVAAFVSVALPRANAEKMALGLLDGMNPLASEFGVALAGGDTNAWDGPLVVSVTVIGEAVGNGPVTRSGAQVGDAIFVTGRLGGSLIQGRHLRPRPRIREALTLHDRLPLHAMIDLSDGLGGDLSHILSASCVGATLEADAIPIHGDVDRSIDREQAIAAALGDGEDFELCFTVTEADANALLANPPAGVSLFRVGTIEKESGLRLRQDNGQVRAISAQGFDHLALVSKGQP